MKVFGLENIITKIKNFDFSKQDSYRRLFRDKAIRRKAILIIGMLIVFNFAKGCVFKKKVLSVPPRPVTTGAVIQKDVPIYLESFGTFSSPLNVDVRAQVTGRINKVYFKDGDSVKQGDLLYLIDTSEFEAQVRKAQAQLEQDTADLKLKTDTLERNKRLVEKDLISRQEFESLQTEVSQAKARADFDKAVLDLASIDLGYCSITSPIDGVLSKSLCDPGNVVTANDGPVLVNVKRLDELNLDFTLSERELSAVRQALQNGVLKVEIYPEGQDKAYSGELNFIDNTVDNTTGTISVRAVLDNKSGDLWPGQFVTIRLILDIAKNAVLVPYEAVNIGQNGHYVFAVDSNGKADLRNIEIGLREGEYIIAGNGISPGEKVVLTGELGLYPGCSVVDIALLAEKGNKKK